MLEIGDIFVWIQISGSVLLTNGSGSGSCKQATKKFFCLSLFEGTFTSSFKDKKSKRSHKTVGIKGFLVFLLVMKDPDPYF
jgi:hypothetical protein